MSALLCTVILIIISFACFHYHRLQKKRKIKLPGLPGYPIIGNALDAKFDKLHLQLYEWSKTYGHMFHLQLFGNSALLVGKSQDRGSDFHQYLIELNDSQNIYLNQGVDTLYTHLPFLRFLPLSPTTAFKRAKDMLNGLTDFLEKQTTINFQFKRELQICSASTAWIIILFVFVLKRDLAMVYIILYVVLAMVSLVYIHYHRSQQKKIKLPGPPGYPIIGNALDVKFDKLHLQLYEWSKTYGHMFQFQLFGNSVLVVNSSKLIRELFCTEPNATLTSSRPGGFIRNHYVHNASVSFSAFDEMWVKRRKLLHKLLHAYGGGLRDLEESITTTLTELKIEMHRSDGGFICDPKDVVEDFIIRIIEILLVGKSQRRDSDFHRYLIEFDDTQNVFLNPGVDTLYSSLPFLRFLPLPTSAAFKRAKDLLNWLPDFLEKQQVEGSEGLYHVMKKLLNDEENRWFTKTEMFGILVDVVGGGFLTTRSTLLSLTQILTSKPDVQKILQQEVDRVVGHERQPALSDRPQMPYCEAFILETIRYTSITPVGIMHLSSSDVSFENVHIPKNTMIIANLWTAHHNTQEWPDPFKFDPQRFLNVDGSLISADDDRRKRFLGFSCGKRSCPGEAFAKSRLFLFVSTMMQAFTIQSPTDELPPTLHPTEFIPGIVACPRPYKCKFVKREYTQ